jgi:hypothetical protein
MRSSPWFYRPQPQESGPIPGRQRVERIREETWKRLLEKARKS